MTVKPKKFAAYVAEVTAASQAAHEAHRDLVERNGKHTTSTDLMRIGMMEATAHGAALAKAAA